VTDRVVNPAPNTDDSRLDRALRPRDLSDHEFIGQSGVKRALRLMIQAAKGRNEPVDHILLAGPPGLGKTTLAQIIANEMQSDLEVTSGPALLRPGDLTSKLSAIDASYVLFIDEIHRLGKSVEEILYPAMEDFAFDLPSGNRTHRMRMPPFTVIGATTSAGSLTAALRDRFGVVHRLEFYSVDEAARIVQRSAGILGVTITETGAFALAQRSRGTARVCNRLLRRVRDYAEIEADGVITDDVAAQALDELNVDNEGLDAMDRRILTTLMDTFNGGPAGLQALAASLAEDLPTLESHYEPFLLQRGFIARTPRGRVATRRAYEHLDREPPAVAAEQATLL